MRGAAVDPRWDARRWNELRRQLASVVRSYAPDWRLDVEQLEPGAAVTNIFAHLVELLLARVNGVPRRLGYSFLSDLGAQLVPARAARAPVCFTVVPGTAAPVLVPRGTIVAATGADGPLSFETQADLLASHGELIAAVGADPLSDRIHRPPEGFLVAGALAGDRLPYRLRSTASPRDPSLSLEHVVGLAPWQHLLLRNEESGAALLARIQEIRGAEVVVDAQAEFEIPEGSSIERITSFAPFETDADRGLDEQEHILYLRHDELLALTTAATIEISATGDPGDAELLLCWEAPTVGPDGPVEWSELARTNGWSNVELETSALERVKLPASTDPDEAPGGWIRCRLASKLLRAAGAEPLRLPELAELRVRVRSRAAEGALAGKLPELAFAGTTPLDCASGATMLPFGERPRLLDAFYLASSEAFGKRGAVVTVQVELEGSIAPPALLVEGERIVLFVNDRGRGIDRVSVGRPGGARTPPLAHEDLDYAGLRLEDGALVATADTEVRLVAGIWRASDGLQQLVLRWDSDPAWQSGPAVIGRTSGWSPRLAVAILQVGAQRTASILVRGEEGALLEWNSGGSPSPSAIPQIEVASSPSMAIVGPGASASSKWFVFDVGGVLRERRVDNLYQPFEDVQQSTAISLFAEDPSAALRDRTIGRPYVWTGVSGKQYVVVAFGGRIRLFRRTATGKDEIPVPDELGGSNIYGDPIGFSEFDRPRKQVDRIEKAIHLLFRSREGGLLHLRCEEEQGKKWSVVPSSIGNLTTGSSDPAVVVFHDPVSQATSETVAVSAVSASGGRIVIAALESWFGSLLDRRHGSIVEMDGAPNLESGGRGVLLDNPTAPTSIRVVERIGDSRFFRLMREEAQAPILDVAMASTVRRIRHAGTGAELVLNGGTEFKVGTSASDPHVPVQGEWWVILKEGSLRFLGQVTSGDGVKPVIIKPMGGDVPTQAEIVDPEIVDYLTLADDWVLPILIRSNDQLREAPASAVRVAELDEQRQHAGVTIRKWHVLRTGTTEARSVVAQFDSNPDPAMNLAIAANGESATLAGSFAIDETQPRISWEYWNGKGWLALSAENAGALDASGRPIFEDSTNALLGSGSVRFRVPRDQAVAEVMGQKSQWIRVRLVGGEYVREQFVPQTNDEPQHFELRGPGAPRVRRLLVSFLSPSSAFERVLAWNNLEWRDHTDAARGTTLAFAPFEGLESELPALYLGFSRELSRTLSLFLAAREHDGERVAVQWEGLRGGAWHRLAAEDDTEDLTRSGIASLALGAPLDRASRFGIAASWIRAVWRAGSGNPSYRPRIDIIAPNAVWARQLRTIQDEILGSSNGEPRQEFAVRTPPICRGNGDRFDLRVREPANEEERRRLENELGEEVVAERRRADGSIETWVRWTAVSGFGDSGPDSRHYVLDEARGLVQFGDGKRGRIPPADVDNLRVFSYRSGGGRAGNVDAYAITRLASAVSGIRQVRNLVAAGGGTDTLGLEDSAAIAAARLHHGDRAIALEDFEELALAADPRIARARCVRDARAQRAARPGWIQVYVLPQASARIPRPSLALRVAIEEFLRSRASGELAVDERIRVLAPRFVEVQVALRIAVRSVEAVARADREARAALESFLHPVSGGRAGEGWDFGRGPQASDLLAALKSAVSEGSVVRLEFQARRLDDDDRPRKGQPELSSTSLELGPEEIAVGAELHFVEVDVREVRT
ncbi:MAG: putative baseplate assembly protein [Planctomycetes bacterium]|nr:putative baseplate assembly protein [Planctomycetota bacterium]